MKDLIEQLQVDLLNAKIEKERLAITAEQKRIELIQALIDLNRHRTRKLLRQG